MMMISIISNQGRHFQKLVQDGRRNLNFDNLRVSSTSPSLKALDSFEL